MKFRKKPLVIDAIQWIGEREPIIKFMGDRCSFSGYNCLTIHTREGNMTANINDWIIRGVKGEFYPCKDNIFKETYEKVIE